MRKNNLTIDKEFSLFSEVSVNDRTLTQNVDYTITSGSTQVTLLPNYLDALEDGFHTLTVTFSDGASVEEQFIVVDTMESEMPPVDNIYIGDQLAYSNGEVLVEESFFDSLTDKPLTLKVEFADGRVLEEEISIEGDGTNDEGVISSLNRYFDSISHIAPLLLYLAITIAAILLILLSFLLVRKYRKKHSGETAMETGSVPAFCEHCGNSMEEGGIFCGNCGREK